jgi:hypothetical protein
MKIHPTPHCVDIGMIYPEDETDLQAMNKFDVKRAYAYLRELRKERKLCGKLGHTIIARYQLKGDVDEVIKGLENYAHEKMAFGMTAEEIPLQQMKEKRVNQFLEKTWYKMPIVIESHRITREVFNKEDFKDEDFDKVLEADKNIDKHINRLHDSKQCLCYCNN